MEPTKSVSKKRVVLTWVMIVGWLVLIACICFWRFHVMSTESQADANADETEVAPIVHSIALFIIGLFFLVPAVAAYLGLIFSCFLTFNYQLPVWHSIKAKRYFFNIFVGVGLALGFGFIVAAFLWPFLSGLGLPQRQASLLPVFAVLIGFQLLRLWVLMWAPVEKLLIRRRLAAMGISAEQLKGAMLVGISNPEGGMVKRFGAIEEDMGSIWVLPDRLAYRGDVEQFDLTREQIAGIERKADNRSTTVLAGIAHVVLQVRLPDGSIRQMRLHTEGQWTLGQKRRAMDALAQAVDGWYAGQAAVADPS
ncbi:MAG TPA: hypothetical protein VNV43_09560 [Candidatus Acidoferrales bacterium]|jgi:hypothetical protein|nr:hypothetical protein [Candidatus Acidoferrales bacterium]